MRSQSIGGGHKEERNSIGCEERKSYGVRRSRLSQGGVCVMCVLECFCICEDS